MRHLCVHVVAAAPRMVFHVGDCLMELLMMQHSSAQ